MQIQNFSCQHLSLYLYTNMNIHIYSMSIPHNYTKLYTIIIGCTNIISFIFVYNAWLRLDLLLFVTFRYDGYIIDATVTGDLYNSKLRLYSWSHHLCIKIRIATSLCHLCIWTIYKSHIIQTSIYSLEYV